MARGKGRKGRSKKRYGARNVHVKGHTRSPRGSNAGKTAVRVKGYRRRPPNN